MNKGIKDWKERREKLLQQRKTIANEIANLKIVQDKIDLQIQQSAEKAPDNEEPVEVDEEHCALCGSRMHLNTVIQNRAVMGKPILVICFECGNRIDVEDDENMFEVLYVTEDTAKHAGLIGVANKEVEMNE